MSAVQTRARDLGEFRTLLETRNMTITQLAKLVPCGRAHLTQVLLGRRPGPETREKLRTQLTVRERAALGWEAWEIDYEI